MKTYPPEGKCKIKSPPDQNVQGLELVGVVSAQEKQRNGEARRCPGVERCCDVLCHSYDLFQIKPNNNNRCGRGSRSSCSSSCLEQLANKNSEYSEIMRCPKTQRV